MNVLATTVIAVFAAVALGCGGSSSSIGSDPGTPPGGTPPPPSPDGTPVAWGDPCPTSAGQWTAMSAAGAPSGRFGATAVWTGAKMIVWGGTTGNQGAPFGTPATDGALYDPCANSWMPMSADDAPPPGSVNLWTGTNLLVWGGTRQGATVPSGGLFDPLANRWTPIRAVSGLFGGTQRAVWTGTQMIVWGYDKATYDVASASWTPFSVISSPEPAQYQVVTWTGSSMLVWGPNSQLKSVGGLYDPVKDTWTAASNDSAPSSRYGFGSVWTGSKFFVWGGTTYLMPPATPNALADGALYDPQTNTWKAISPLGAPSARTRPSVIWTGGHVLVWGGSDLRGTPFNDGALYDPEHNTWSPLPAASAPSARIQYTSINTGGGLLVWGGTVPAAMGNGGLFDVGASAWAPIAAPANVLLPRTESSVVWTGRRMIVWGGRMEIQTPNCGCPPNAPACDCMPTYDFRADGALYQP